MGARFGRVVTAMVTPFRSDDLSLDLDEAQRLARYLIDNGSDGIVVSGSTGESPTLTHEEKNLLLKAVVEAAGNDAFVTCGTGTYSTQDSIELSQMAEKAGAQGLLVVTPYYNRPPQDALVKHFCAIADCADLPVMLYDIPSRTALKIEPDTLLRAAEHPRIVAVKEAAGDQSALARFMARKPDDFELYSGNDDWTLGLQGWGAVGVVSVLAHVVGVRIREQFDAFESGDLDGARRAQASYMDIHAACFASTNPIGVKAAMEMLGLKVGPLRAPLTEADDDLKAKIRKALTDFGALQGD